MKLLLILLLTACSLSYAQAQQDIPADVAPARHAVFLELGGNGMAYSINYDRLLTTSTWFRTTARAGVFAQWWRGGAFGVPLEINGLIGKQKHFLEVGVGAMYSYGIEGIVYKDDPYDPQGQDTYDNYSALHASGRLGYRFQKQEGGFFLRIAYTPMARLITDNPYYEKDERVFGGFWHWFGLSVGRSF